MPRILGIDSSLTGTGLCRADLGIQPPPVEAVLGSVQLATVAASKSDPKHTWLDKSRRVHEVLDQVAAALDDLPLDAVGLEELAYGAKGSAVVVLHWLWGEIVELVRVRNIPLYLVNVSGVKKFAANNGNAAKDQVMLAMANRYPQHAITNNNEADALAVCMMVARAVGVPFDTMPAAHLTALQPDKKGKAKVALQ